MAQYIVDYMQVRTQYFQPIPVNNAQAQSRLILMRLSITFHIGWTGASRIRSVATSWHGEEGEYGIPHVSNLEIGGMLTHQAIKMAILMDIEMKNVIIERKCLTVISTTIRHLPLN